MSHLEQSCRLQPASPCAKLSEIIKTLSKRLKQGAFSSHRTPLKTIDLSKPKLRERAPRPKPLKLDLKP